jgi:hypothetical protein
MSMSEEEYLEGEPDSNEDDDGEFSDTFLSEESDDEINVIVLKKLDYDKEEFLRGYLKLLKRSNTTDEALDVLYELSEQIRLITMIEIETVDLQNKAEQLESLMACVSF